MYPRVSPMSLAIILVFIAAITLLAAVLESLNNLFIEISSVFIYQ
jgi:hypothetical protein